MRNLTGADIICECLIEQGVDTVFGYPGGAVLNIYDSLYNYSDKIHHVLTAHEQGASHAADGYARSTGRTGVVIATSGPGATNLVTGIATAYMDSVPMVAITGNVACSLLGLDSFQEVDITGITMPITKHNFIVKDVNKLADTLREAFYIAGSGRKGPVLVDVPKDITAQKAEFVNKPLKPYTVNVTMHQDGCIAKAAELIKNAERPFLYTGGGIYGEDGAKTLKAFAELIDAPVSSSLMGQGSFDETDSRYMGMLGMHGNLAPNVKTNECDVLIAVGMRFDDRVTGNLDTYAKQAKVIHFDIDPAEINKNVKADVAVLGDCKETLRSVTDLLVPAKHKEWIDSFAPYTEEERTKVIEPEVNPAKGPLNMGEVVRAVSDATRNEAVLVTDVGQNQMMSARYFRYSRNRSIVTSGGLGTMGFGLPAAVGATFAVPDRTVCVFMGDGGLQMNLQELGTVMEQKAPVKMILLNNNYLGNVRQWQAMFFNRKYSFTPMLNPDYMKIAEAYGIPSRRVVERADLPSAIEEMLATDGPFLLEACVVEEGNVLPMTPPGGSVNAMLLEC